MRSHEEDVTSMVGELIPDKFAFIEHLKSCVVAEAYEARDQVWSVSEGGVVMVLYCKFPGCRDLFAVNYVIAPIISDASKFPAVFFGVFVKHIYRPLNWRTDLVGDFVVYRRETRRAGRDVLSVLF